MKSRNSVCSVKFVAQFQPPINGLTEAVERLWNSKLSEKYTFSRINLINNLKFPMTVVKLFLAKDDIYYFTPAETQLGNLRDLITLMILNHKKGKTVIHLHGGTYRKLVETGLPSWQKHLNYVLFSKVDTAIVLGEGLRYIFEGIVPDNRIVVVPNYVGNEFLPNQSKIEIKAQQSKLKAPRDVLYLSNFYRFKGYQHFLALAVLEKKRRDAGNQPEFNFHMAGAFPEDFKREDLDAYIHDNGLEDIVQYYGIVRGEEKKALLKKCDLFVLLSVREGQPISILEALGNGLSIVTTNEAAIPDMVTDQVNGLVFEKSRIDVKKIYNEMLNFDSSKRMLNNWVKIQRSYLESRYLNDMDTVFERTFLGDSSK